jgi:hypothetical protein
MGIKGKIYSLLASSVLLIFLAASSGIAITTHTCHHCGEKTTLAVFHSESENHSHLCCNHGSGCHSPEQGHSELLPEGCCDIKLSVYKVTNYIPEFSGKTIVWSYAVAEAVQPDQIPVTIEQKIPARYLNPKYGGPPSYTLHRQLLI